MSFQLNSCCWFEVKSWALPSRPAPVNWIRREKPLSVSCLQCRCAIQIERRVDWCNLSGYQAPVIMLPWKSHYCDIDWLTCQFALRSHVSFCWCFFCSCSSCCSGDMPSDGGVKSEPQIDWNQWKKQTNKSINSLLVLFLIDLILHCFVLYTELNLTRTTPCWLGNLFCLLIQLSPFRVVQLSRYYRKLTSFLFLPTIILFCRAFKSKYWKGPVFAFGKISVWPQTMF